MAGTLSHVGARISPSSSLLDEDPGIMSEAETSSTGFRRGIKPRSSLPIVRTPSKTFERPLGLVFLQFRNETKRALLPNEITSLDTVKALFVRSFPQQLSMDYLDSRNVRVYIHDSGKDMFYELEDLRDIRDRAVLRLFETEAVVGMGGFPSTLPVPMPVPTGGVSSPSVTSPRLPISPSINSSWDHDLSYFSEPEFDSEYQHQHVHKAKVSTKPPAGPGPTSYYTINRHGYNPSAAANPPTSLLQPMTSLSSQGRPVPMQRSFSPAVVERSLSVPGIGSSLPSPGKTRVYPPLSVNVQGEGQMSRSMFPSQPSPQPPRPPERSYSVGGTNYLSPPTGYPAPIPPYCRSGMYEEAFGAAPPPPPPYLLNAGAAVDEETRLRMEHVERQLASLTGLVQTALTSSNSPRGGETETLKEDKYVSFEKSVSFSEDPVDCVSEGKHSPQPTESKPAKPAIKSSTLPRASSTQALPLKGEPGSGLLISGDFHSQLKQLQKRARDLRQEIRSLRRLTQAQAAAFQEVIKDTTESVTKSLTKNSDLLANALKNGDSLAQLSWHKVQQDEDNYHREMQRLEQDLSELEISVEDLRSNVINKKTRVNMTDVEQLIVLLSRSSKTIGTLKEQFPSLQDSIKNILTYQMDKVAEEEKFLAEEPGKLEIAIRRCKKLTSTLVTLKRLASVQEQRQPVPVNNDQRSSKSFPNDPQGDSLSSSTVNPLAQGAPTCPPRRASSSSTASGFSTGPGSDGGLPAVPPRGAGSFTGATVESQGPPLPPRTRQSCENPLDALLDELEAFSQPGTWTQSLSSSSTSSPRPSRRPQPSIPGTEGGSSSSLERKSSSKPLTYAETSLDDIVPPPTPTRRAPPPPPPRTSSRSPLMSPQGSLHKYRVHGDSSQQQQQQSIIKVAPWVASSGSQAVLTTARKDPSSLPVPPQRTSVATVDDPGEIKQDLALSSRSTSSESVNSQEGASSASGISMSRSIKSNDDKDPSSAPQTPPSRQRQEVLEQRHQELLKKQRQLQEQYARLQQLQRSRPMPIAMGVSVLQQTTSSATSQESRKVNNISGESAGSSVDLTQDDRFNDVPETDII